MVNKVDNGSLLIGMSTLIELNTVSVITVRQDKGSNYAFVLNYCKLLIKILPITPILFMAFNFANVLHKVYKIVNKSTKR